MALNIRVLLLSFLLFLPRIEGEEARMVSNQILYRMHTGEVSEAFALYREHQKSLGHHDQELLQQIGLTLLDQGSRSHDAEIRLLTIFGAGISSYEKALYILEEAAGGNNPKMQLVALNYLARSQHDRADDAIQRCLTSDSLLIRLEALLYLAEKHHPRATAQTEALMCKLPQDLLPIFPQIFAVIGDESSTISLRKLLAHPVESVRIAAVFAVAKCERDDLLPQIRNLATHGEITQQEGCAIALGFLGDEHSLPRLQTLARSHVTSVRLAACHALYRLGRKENRLEIEKEAKEGNIFAIAMLSEMPGSEETLAQLVRSHQLQIRINAALSLLKLGDRRCLSGLKEMLINDSRDLAFERMGSHGLGLTAFRAIPSAQVNLADDPLGFEVSLSLREDALRETINLPETSFLALAESLFESHQNDLIPTLTDLLATLHNDPAKALLKKYSQKAGAPLIRHSCNLALFNMKEEGPYEEQLRHFILHQQDQELIRFRPALTIERRDFVAGSPLTPQEQSRLLIASFEAFARTQNDKGIDVLLEAMQNGNPKNRYALAGLLIRTTF
ncbi:MAG: HEAT repeat domain-containing protein [Parachlamydia sp.]|nr:HEAT repeat domain-containing protein [Parachlamydia sp.]